LVVLLRNIIGTLAVVEPVDGIVQVMMAEVESGFDGPAQLLSYPTL